MTPLAALAFCLDCAAAWDWRLSRTCPWCATHLWWPLARWLDRDVNREPAAALRVPPVTANRQAGDRAEGAASL